MKLTQTRPEAQASYSMKHRGGFALVISLMLMAFVLLLMVTLSSFLQVEIKSANVGKQNLKAQENALLGLQIALGELQQLAGADQRVTATAEIQELTTAPNSGAKSWVGVWARDSDPATATQAKPVLLDWLVSRNEGVGYVVDASGAVTSATATSDIPFRPDMVIQGVDATTTLSSTISIDGQSARLLVGAGTLGASHSDIYVVAPFVEVASEGSHFVEGFAWWVGDEGVKARVNIVDSFSGQTDDLSRDLRLRSAQRSGVEVIPGFSQYSPNEAILGRIVDHSQIELGTSLDPTVLAGHFHDVTVHSNGVLSNAREGGLMHDMSYLFAQPTVAELHQVLEQVFTPATVSHPSANPLMHPDTTPYATAVPVDFRKQSVTWEQLWSFGNMGKSSTDGGVFLPSGSAQPRAHNENQHGISPLLVHARYGFGLRVDSSRRVYLHIRPLVVIGNPYGVDLAGEDYYVQLVQDTGVAVYRPDVDSLPPSNQRDWAPSWHASLNQLFSAASVPPGRIDIRIPAAISSLAAGEARVFTLPAGLLVENTGGATTTYDLVNNYNELSSIYIDTGVTVTEAELDAAAGGGGVKLTLWGAGEPRWQLKLGSGSAPGKDPFLQTFYGHGVGNSGNSTVFVDAVHSTNDNFIHWGGGYYMSTSDVQGNREANPFYEYNLRAILNPSGDADVPQDRTVSQFNSAFFTNVALEEPDAALDQKKARWGEYNRGSSLLQNVNPQGPGFSENPSLQWITYDVPRPDRPVASLGHLAHLNSSGIFTGGFLSDPDRAPFFPQLHQSSFPIANAYASVRVPRDSVFNSPAVNHGFYDASFLFNTILFDRFTVTTFPYEAGVDSDFMDSADVNRRYRPYAEFSPVPPSDLESRSAASRLLVEGAFNVNSTSVPAWTALIASLYELDYKGSANDDLIPYLRSQGQVADAVSAETGATPAAWSGYRPLSETEAKDLASAIVHEVKERGPFLSMAAFVNRTLEAGTASSDPSYSGALQAALDSAVNTGVEDTYLKTSHNKSGTAVISDNRVPNRVVGAPGWLLQSDLLAPLAPILQVRSDTFVIRSMGEVQSAISGEVNRAWCEATYQRIPEYVESQEDAKLYPPTLSTNQKFGRRFVLVDFRWLNPSEI